MEKRCANKHITAVINTKRKVAVCRCVCGWVNARRECVTSAAPSGIVDRTHRTIVVDKQMIIAHSPCLCAAATVFTVDSRPQANSSLTTNFVSTKMIDPWSKVQSYAAHTAISALCHPPPLSGSARCTRRLTHAPKASTQFSTKILIVCHSIMASNIIGP